MIHLSSHRNAPRAVGIGQDYYHEEADAAERQEYYQPIQDVLENGDGDDVYRSLNKLLRRTHRDLGYKTARKHLYRTIDRRPDGALYYLYSGEGPKNEEEVDSPNRRRLGGYNCEHVVPQSWFRKRTPMKSDLHHLFTEKVRCNSSRANYNLTEVEGEKLTNCGIVDHRDDEFEPNAGKGAVARATLYFLVRHPGYVGDKDVETSPEDLKQLLEWHEQYPVTDYERHRNETIQDVQGNRNPFIDFPKLTERVDFQQGFAS
jgi:endonuclease G, mitochondrial